MNKLKKNKSFCKIILTNNKIMIYFYFKKINNNKNRSNILINKFKILNQFIEQQNLDFFHLFLIKIN